MKWFRNSVEYLLLATLPVWWASGTLLGALAYPQPTPLLLAGSLLSLLLLMAIIAPVSVLKVGISPGRVAIKRLFTTLVIDRRQVMRVALVPPIDDVTRKTPWWRGSVSGLSIEYKDRRKKPTVLNNISPEGLKLRVARTLNPENYAGDPLELV